MLGRKRKGKWKGLNAFSSILDTIMFLCSLQCLVGDLWAFEALRVLVSRHVFNRAFVDYERTTVRTSHYSYQLPLPFRLRSLLESIVWP